jgi:hypothetical protein
MKHRIYATQHLTLILCLSVLTVGLLPRYTAAAELGRLFSTASERQQLNQMRNTGSLASIPIVPISPPQMSPVDEPIRFNGFVRRSSGRSDAWINGRHAGSDQALSRKLGSSNTIRVTIPDSKRTVRMKAGQEVDPVTGKVQEVYKRHRTDNRAQSQDR